MNKKKCLLPSAVIKKLNGLTLSVTQHNQALDLLHKVCFLQSIYSFQEFVPISSTEIKKISSHYHRFIEKLKPEILNCTESYSDGSRSHDFQSFTKSYGIKIELLNSELIPFSYRVRKPKTRKSFRFKTILDNLDQIEVDKEGIEQFINKKVNSISAKSFKLNEEITTSFIYNLRFNTKKKQYEITTSKALALAKAKNLDLIQDGRKFFIDNVKFYTERKKCRVRKSYTLTLNILLDKDFKDKIKRNGNNGRIDTPVTNIPSGFLKFLKAKGQRLQSIDLQNSQFSFLDYLLTNLSKISNKDYSNSSFIKLLSSPLLNRYYSSITSDILFNNTSIEDSLFNYSLNMNVRQDCKLRKNDGATCTFDVLDKNGASPSETLINTGFNGASSRDTSTNGAGAKGASSFRNLADFGASYFNDPFHLCFQNNQDLYSVMQEKCELATRAEAKLMLFTVVFSSYRAQSKEKQIFRKNYPQVFGFIDAFKKTFGDNQFSIMLQRLESEIMVNMVQKELKRKKIFYLGKHDEILCKESDLEKVKGIIQDIFHQIGLNAVLNSEKLFTSISDTPKEKFKITRAEKTACTIQDTADQLIKENKKVTQKKVASLLGFSLRTVKTYWPKIKVAPSEPTTINQVEEHTATKVAEVAPEVQPLSYEQKIIIALDRFKTRYVFRDYSKFKDDEITNAIIKLQEELARLKVPFDRFDFKGTFRAA